MEPECSRALGYKTEGVVVDTACPAGRTVPLRVIGNAPPTRWRFLGGCCAMGATVILAKEPRNLLAPSAGEAASRLLNLEVVPCVSEAPLFAGQGIHSGVTPAVYFVHLKQDPCEKRRSMHTVD